MAKIRKLYQIEQTLRGQELSAQAFGALRRKKAEPVLEELNQWLGKKSEQVVPQSLVGNAVSYTLSQWEPLTRYLDRPWLTPDNNAAENAICSFVVGRKNRLFSGSPRGADASCAIYSLIETAKQNRMNPYAYLYFVFTKVPQIADDGGWDALLPWNLTAHEVNEAPFADLRFH